MQSNILLEHLLKEFTKNRRWFGLSLICFGAIVATYWVYINNMHFSSDTFNAILDPNSVAETNLRNGRILHFLFYSLLGCTGINILAHERIIQLVLAAVCSICVTAIANRLTNALRCNSSSASIASCILVLFLFINPSFQTGWFYWPETSLGASLSIATCTLAILFWCKKERTRADALISLVLLIAALEMYQVYLELYIGVCVAYSIAKENFEPNRTSVRELLTVITFGVIASLINIALMKALQQMGMIVVDERSTALSFSVLIANIVAIAQLQLSILQDFEFNLAGMPLAILVLLIIPILANKSISTSPKKFIWVSACALLSYLVAFSPLLVSGKFWPAPRTYIGIYCVVIILGLFSLSTIKSNRSALTYFSVALIAMLVIVSSTLLKAQESTLCSNQEDNREIQQICHSLNDYESRTETTIKQLVLFYDSSRTYYYPDVEYRVYDSNVRGMAYAWCFEGMMKYWGGFNGSISLGTDDERFNIFGDCDWDSLTLSDQLTIDGETAYLCVY